MTGGLLGAVYGIAGIPMRWTSVLNGVVPGYVDRSWDLMGLQHLARCLGGDLRPWPFELDPEVRGVTPMEVFEGIWASDVFGAQGATDRVRRLWPHLNLWNDSFRTALEAFEASPAGSRG